MLANRMMRDITVLNFLFNHFLRTEFFSSFYQNGTLRTFRPNFGIYQNTECSTHKEAIFLLTNMTKSNHLQSFVHVILISLCHIK